MSQSTIRNLNENNSTAWVKIALNCSWYWPFYWFFHCTKTLWAWIFQIISRTLIFEFFLRMRKLWQTSAFKFFILYILHYILLWSTEFKVCLLFENVLHNFTISTDILTDVFLAFFNLFRDQFCLFQIRFFHSFLIWCFNRFFHKVTRGFCTSIIKLLMKIESLILSFFSIKLLVFGYRG